MKKPKLQRKFPVESVGLEIESCSWVGPSAKKPINRAATCHISQKFKLKP
jgi:hypothetical protein